MNNNTPLINNNTFQDNFQLFLPIDIGVYISPNAPVRELSTVLEGLDYNRFSQDFSNKKGRKVSISPKIMMKIIIFCFGEGYRSTREIEQHCSRDTHCMWLLRGKKAPDHNTINRFLIKHEEAIEDIFYQFSNFLITSNEANLENVFIDGTKIEASSNKYSFVWKKTIEYHYRRLKDKALDFQTSFNIKYETNFWDLYQIKNFIEDKIYSENIQLKNRKKLPLQKELESVIKMIEKDEEYVNHFSILKDRNSYSKTDNDATFMRMKDDHMRNGQLKPAYNAQLAVNSEYILGVQLFQNPTDVRTLIPFLKNLENRNLKFKNIVADAGYESEENYVFLKENSYTSFIKPQYYEKQKKRSFKKDISKVENMIYDEETDTYTCFNSKQLKYMYTSKKKNKYDFVSEKRVYECNDCSNCPHSSKCKKTDNNKKIYVAKEFLKYRQESFDNITSEMGILLRTNRSIQVEGAFGDIKSNYSFNRFNYRNMERVNLEFLLVSFGYNIRKYTNKILKNRQKTSLHPIKQAS